jgi:hypothetical protein
MAATATRTPQEITAEILSRLDVAGEFAALGVKISGTPRASGMVSCYAWGRDDRRPSAWINVRSAMYGDSGGKEAPAFTCSLFDLAVKAGRFSDWKEARRAYAEKASVAIGREAKSGGKAGATDWHQKLELQDWSTPGNDVLLLRWCTQFKPGVAPESVKAAGGQLAYYPCWIDKKTGEKHRTRDCHQVVAIPCYGSWLLDAEPVAWAIWDVCGREFDVTPKDTPPSEPRVMAKMLSVGPTAGAIMGLSSLMMLCDPDRRAAVEIAWKVEGPADMLAQWASVPEADREKVVILTAAGGATADVHPHQAKLFAGLRTAIVPDCDQAGVVGAEKWCRALYGLTAESRVVRLPWEVKPSHGEDVRDYLTGKDADPPGPRAYADLLQLWQAAEPWEPSGPEAGAVVGEMVATPTGSVSLDYFTDQEIATALKIDVLGQREDGTIEVYSEHLRRTVAFKGVAKLKYPDMLQLFGTPVRRAVSKTNEDAAPGMYPISDVREAIGHLASRCLLHDQTKLGAGCWPIDDGGDDPVGIISVNAGDALHYNGAVERVTHPRHHGQLLAFESVSREWFDYEELVGLIERARNPQFRTDTVMAIANLFARWRWRDQTIDPTTIAGLILATWVQVLWKWRPRIDVLGASTTGKSMLCEALSGIFGDLSVSTSDASAAGLRQKMQSSAIVVLIDEVDSKEKAKLAEQRKILEMLRAASRGSETIRGTGDQKGMSFMLRHLVWVAGIAIRYDDQADRNRAISLELLPPLPEMKGKLTVPPRSELRDLGQRSLAVALHCVLDARRMATAMKDHQIDGIDQRVIESYAVPASMLRVATAEVWGLSAEALLERMAVSVRESSAAIESDEVNLIHDILGGTVQMGTAYRLTAGQAIDVVRDPTTNISIRQDWRKALEGVGLKITTGSTETIAIAYQLVRRKLLYGTRWSDQPIDQYLRRVDGRSLKLARCGGVRSRVIEFPLAKFVEAYMGEDDPAEQVIDSGF